MNPPALPLGQGSKTKCKMRSGQRKWLTTRLHYQLPLVFTGTLPILVEGFKKKSLEVCVGSGFGSAESIIPDNLWHTDECNLLWLKDKKDASAIAYYR